MADGRLAPGSHRDPGVHPVTLTLTDAGGASSTASFTLDVRRVWAHDDETIFVEPRPQAGLLREVRRGGGTVAEIVRGDVTFQPYGANYWQSLFVPTPAIPNDMQWRLVLHRPDANGNDTKTYLSGVQSGMQTVTWDSRTIPDGTYAVSYEFTQGSSNPSLDITRYIERPITVVVDNQAGAITGAQWLPLIGHIGYRYRWREPIEAIQWIRYSGNPAQKHTVYPYPYSFATPPTTDAARQALVDPANLVAETWMGPLNNRYTTESSFARSAEGHPFIIPLSWESLDSRFWWFTDDFPERDGGRNNAAISFDTQFRPVPGPDPSLIGIDTAGRIVKINPQATGDDLVTTLAGWVMRDDALPLWDGTADHLSAKRLVGTFEDNLFLRAPRDLAMDPANPNRVYIADTENNRIALADITTGAVTTFAGDMSFKDSYGVPIPGYQDGPRLAARFNGPSGVEIIGPTLYVADRYNNAIRAINLDTGQVTTPLGRGPGAPQVPSDQEVFQNRDAWTFARISFDNSPVVYPRWIRQDSQGQLYVQEFASEGRGTANMRRINFAQREVVQIARLYGANFEVDRLGKFGSVDDLLVRESVNLARIERYGSDGTFKRAVTTYSSPLFYGRGESNPLMTENGQTYPINLVIDDQEAKLGFTSVYRSGFTVLRPRLASDPPAAHDAKLYDEGRAVDIAGTSLAFFPNRSRPSFATLHGRFGHNWLGNTATFDDLALTMTDAQLADYIQEGMGGLVYGPDIRGRDLRSLIYFLRLSSLQGKLQTIDPNAIAANLDAAGYYGPNGRNDLRLPEIRGVQLYSISPTTAYLTFDTDEPTLGLIKHGRTDYYGLSIEVGHAYAKRHAALLRNLPAGEINSHHYQILMKDPAGNVVYTQDATLANAQPLPADGAPPIISNVAASNLTSDSAEITWDTNELATSRVDYGLTSSYGSTRRVDDWLRIDHPMTLAHLTPGTLYHFKVCSEDAFNNAACSGNFTFTTPANEALLCGDANKDGQVNIADAVQEIRFILNIDPPPGSGTPLFIACDVNGDDALNIADPVLLIKHILGEAQLSCRGG